MIDLPATLAEPTCLSLQKYENVRAVITKITMQTSESICVTYLVISTFITWNKKHVLKQKQLTGSPGPDGSTKNILNVLLLKKKKKSGPMSRQSTTYNFMKPLLIRRATFIIGLDCTVLHITARKHYSGAWSFLV